MMARVACVFSAIVVLKNIPPSLGLPQECPPVSNVTSLLHSHYDLYDDKSKNILRNWTHFLANFQKSDFDSWGKSYQQVKDDLYDWKVVQYLSFLEPNNVVFESASGIGLHAHLTLELFHQQGLSNVTIHGNDMVTSSVNIANRLLSETFKDGQHLFCVADSTNLHYIPDNSYDLVFTGYVTPLHDPLGLDLPEEETFQHMENICKSIANGSSDWRDLTLQRLAQKAQDEWFDRWFREMVRIAKPGAPVIVEQVSPPFCEAPHDWGGVTRSFWEDHPLVDSKSLSFGDSKHFRTRYHVFVRKKFDDGRKSDELHQ